MTVREIYHAIDALAPFASQEKWDNSGLLVGSMDDRVSGVMVTLDITKEIILLAAEKGCNVIVSHHPVIFSPLHTIDRGSVPFALAAADMNAICCHTPLDIAAGGLNDLLAEHLCRVLPVTAIAPFAPDGLGRILTLDRPHSLSRLAEAAKEALDCETVRYSAPCGEVQRIAICTGSGASMLEDCIGIADCLLTGDVKHDRWYKAEELRIGLIDCGHYETEVIMIPYLTKCLANAFPGLHVEAAWRRPFNYV